MTDGSLACRMMRKANLPGFGRSGRCYWDQDKQIDMAISIRGAAERTSLVTHYMSTNVGIFTFESAVARSWINQGPGPMLVAVVSQDPNKLDCVSMGYCKGASGIRLLLGLVTFILCWDKQRHENKRQDVVMRPGILFHRATEQSHE